MPSRDLKSPSTQLQGSFTRRPRGTYPSSLERTAAIAHAACRLMLEDEALVAWDVTLRLTRLGYRIPAMATTGAEAIH